MPAQKTAPEPQLNFEGDTSEVRFGGHNVAVAGLIAGTSIAVVVPSVQAICHQNNSGNAWLIISMAALMIGGGIAGISAFFGSVVPSTVKRNEANNTLDKAVEILKENTDVEDRSRSK